MSLEETFRRLGEGSRDDSASRLKRGLGVEGSLRPKVRDDGKPLGGRLPALIRKGRVKVFEDGWEETYPSEELEAFHAGRPGQRGRPVIGLSREGRREAALAIVAELALEAQEPGGTE